MCDVLMEKESTKPHIAGFKQNTSLIMRFSTFGESCSNTQGQVGSTVWASREVMSSDRCQMAAATRSPLTLISLLLGAQSLPSRGFEYVQW